jgi:protease-4
MKNLLFLLLLSAAVFGQGARESFYDMNAFSFTSPGAMKYGLYGFDNPALLATVTAPDVMVNFTTYKKKWDDVRRVGVYTASPGFGFAVNDQKVFNNKVTDYRVSFGGGSAAYGFGFGYGWSNGDRDVFGRSSLWTLGILSRPSQYLSIGSVMYIPEKAETEASIDAAYRPFGNEKVSLFADAVFRKNAPDDMSKWSAGIAVEALPGFRVTGRYFEKKAFTVGVQLELGAAGFSSQSYFNTNNDYAFNSYGIRLGAYDRNLAEQFQKPEGYLYLKMNSGVKYQRYRLFDNANTLKELLENLEHAKNDPAIGGVVINTVDFYTNKVMYWEIREKLKEVKAAGKKVIVYLERASLDLYRFATVADEIYMEPLGSMTMEGYILGRSYLKGTLEKLGIGYDEWRFFKYKSAAEGLSRESMSEADREQRQALVDDWYDEVKGEITQARNLTGEKYDELVNKKVFFTAQEALDNKLIDKIARWDSLDAAIRENDGYFVSTTGLKGNKAPKDNRWGVKPNVAVIYAIGACAMDEGINARSLVNFVNKAVKDDNVKAIVLRVDSPGGDALASDYISEALLKAKGKKPVIVSQGSVAASGGYWLSMYADTIIAAPATITGSIGVIGGWFYNKNLLQDAGITLDHVKKGDHADLGFGFTFPLINFPLAQRNMNENERKMMETMITGFYKDFVNKVAKGRNSTYDKIHEVAQGRVWTGTDGLGLGLIDQLGGLELAISIAADKAGLKKGDYNVIEIPDAPLIDFGMFMPSLISAQVINDPLLKDARFRAQHNGRPLMMLPLDLAPDTDFDALMPE